MLNKFVLLTGAGSYSLRELDPDILSRQWIIIEVILAPITLQDYELYNSKKFKGFPVVPGSEAVGKVVYISDSAKKEHSISLGDIVYIESPILCKECYYCLNGEYSVCNKNKRYGSFTYINDAGLILGSYSNFMTLIPGTRLHQVDADFDIELLGFLGVMARAARAVVKKADGFLGKKLGIVGSGLFGLCCGLVASSVGMKSVIIDEGLDQVSIQLCEKFSDVYLDAEKCKEELLSHEAYQCDLDIIVIEKPGLLNVTLDLLKPQGCVIIPPQLMENAAELPLKEISSKELKIVGLKDQAWDFDQAYKVIKNHREDLKKLLNRGFKLDEIDLAMKQFKTNGFMMSWLRPNI